MSNARHGGGKELIFLQDCVGTIDDTPVTANVRRLMYATFHGTKHYTKQNVLAAVHFDMRFTCVLAGWEVSAHDASILADTLSRPDGFKSLMVSSILEMLDMHADLVFYLPSGKQGTTSTSSLRSTDLRIRKSCSI
jgi:hypothetical protein